MAWNRHAIICDTRFSSLFSSKRIVLLLLFWIVTSLLYNWPFVNADMFGLDLMGICGIKPAPSGSLLDIYYNFIVVIAMLAYIGVLVFYQLTKKRIDQLLHTMQPRDDESALCEHTKPMLQMIKWVVLVPLLLTVPTQTVALIARFDQHLVSISVRRILLACYPISMLSGSLYYHQVYQILQNSSS